MNDISKKLVRQLFTLAHADFDNDMAAAGLTPPEDEAEHLIESLLTQIRKDVEEVVDTVIELGSFNQDELDILEQQALGAMRLQTKQRKALKEVWKRYI